MKSWERAFAVLDESKQRGSARLLLVVLALFTNEESGKCYPGRKLLAHYLNLDERRVKRLLGKLEAAGELARETSAGPMGTNLYRVLVGGGAETPGAQKPPGRGSVKGGGAETPRTSINQKLKEDEEEGPPVFETLFLELFSLKYLNKVQRDNLRQAASLHDESTFREILLWAAGSGISDTSKILKAAKSWRKIRPEKASRPLGNVSQTQPTHNRPDPERAAKDRQLAELAKKQRAERKQRG